MITSFVNMAARASLLSAAAPSCRLAINFKYVSSAKYVSMDFLGPAQSVTSILTRSQIHQSNLPYRFFATGSPKLCRQSRQSKIGCKYPQTVARKQFLQQPTSVTFADSSSDTFFRRKAKWTISLVAAVGAILASSSGVAETATSTEEENKNVVFTTFGCPYCKRAKNTLRENNVPFNEVLVDKSPSLRDAVVKATGRRTVPVIFVNGQYIGGSDELEKLVSGGELQNLLEASPQKLPEELTKMIEEPTEEENGKAKEKSHGKTSDRAKMRRLRLEQVARMMGNENKGIEKHTLKQGWKTHLAVFSGKETVDWILKNLPDVLDATEAEEMGKELQQAQLLHHFTYSEEFSRSNESFFRLHSDEAPFSSSLNGRQAWLKPARPASDVAEELRTRILELYDFALSPDGRSVNYGSLEGSPEFESYVEATEELQKVDVNSLTREEKLAFWINTYNALVVHTMVAKGQATSVPQRLLFYSVNKYNVGGFDLSLDDMEHGILRGNRPTSLLGTFGIRPFGPKDPRRFWSLTPNEPRIHFALNCGAKSCPPIKVFSAENLNFALDGAVSAFCESEVEINSVTGTITLSKILDWYKVDFGNNMDERLKWLLPFLDEKKRKEMNDLLSCGSYKVEFKPYDWSLND